MIPGMSDDETTRRNSRITLIVAAFISAAITLYASFVELPFGIRSPRYDSVETWFSLGIVAFLSLVGFRITAKRE